MLVDAWKFEREAVDAAYGAYLAIPNADRRVQHLHDLQRTAGHRDALCTAGGELALLDAEAGEGIVCPVPTVMWTHGGVWHVACEEGWTLDAQFHPGEASWCLYVMYADCDPPDPAGVRRLDERVTLHGDRRVYVVG